MSFPMFAGQVTPGTYHLRIIRSATTYDLDFVFTDHYYIPSGTDSLSIWKVLIDEFNAVAGNFSLAWDVTTNEGLKGRIREDSAVSWDIDYTNTSTADDGKLPLVWFGIPNADATSSAVLDGPLRQEIQASQHSQWTWNPKAHLQDLGWTPRPFPTFTTGPTGDGSYFIVVAESDNTAAVRRQFKHVLVDGAAAPGVRGGRLQKQRLDDTFVDWATPIGASSSDPYAALDSPGGFWRATCDGRQFVMTRDESDATSVEGPFIVLRGAEGAPTDNEAWFGGLRPPAVRRSGAGGGRRVVEFSFLDVSF